MYRITRASPEADAQVQAALRRDAARQDDELTLAVVHALFTTTRWTLVGAAIAEIGRAHV